MPELQTLKKSEALKSFVFTMLRTSALLFTDIQTSFFYKIGISIRKQPFHKNLSLLATGSLLKKFAHNKYISKFILHICHRINCENLWRSLKNCDFQGYYKVSFNLTLSKITLNKLQIDQGVQKVRIQAVKVPKTKFKIFHLHLTMFVVEKTVEKEVVS